MSCDLFIFALKFIRNKSLHFNMPDDSIKYPIGVQSFEELRKGGYVYIDKTSIFPELFRKKYYFMSRPRRFGWLFVHI